MLVRVPAELEDPASGALWEAGTRGIEARDAGGGEVALLAYFSARTSLLDDLRAALAPAAPASIEPAAVPEVDWVARFRAGFQAFDAAGFHVVPEWEAGAGGAPGDPRRLIVDPGRAFGTGTHETTRLCLALLSERAARGPLGRVADVGCGTGILSVAAFRLGAAQVLAVDVDPEATASARRHARLNAVGLQVVQGDGARPLAAGRFDLVLANLTAALLVERRDELAALASPGGALVLSGLLVSDLPEVRAAYAPFGRLRERRDGEWTALVVERP